MGSPVDLSLFFESGSARGTDNSSHYSTPKNKAQGFAVPAGVHKFPSNSCDSLIGDILLLMLWLGL